VRHEAGVRQQANALLTGPGRRFRLIIEIYSIQAPRFF
jgi:hypothetical protein